MMPVSGAPETRPSLLLKIRDPGDSEAWSRFVHLYGPLVYQHCRRKGLQDADAVEVMQEVLLQVHRSIAAFDYDVEHGRFRNWLGAVTRSKLNRFWRGREPQRHFSLEEPDQIAAEPDAHWEEDYHRHLLQVALDSVRPHFESATWQAFELVWLSDVPAADVAERLQQPLSWVYVAKSRVLKRLRKAVEQLTGESSFASDRRPAPNAPRRGAAV